MCLIWIFIICEKKCKLQFLDTGLYSLKTASKNVVHEAGDFIGNKTADAITKSNDDNTKKQ